MGCVKMADISVVAPSLGTLMLSLIVLWIAAKWRPSCFNCFVWLRIAAASLGWLSCLLLIRVKTSCGVDKKNGGTTPVRSKAKYLDIVIPITDKQT